MSGDLISESMEALRAERMEAALRRFGPLVLAGVLILIAGIGGWQTYRALDFAGREAQTGSYLAATQRGPEALVEAAQDMRPPLAALAHITAGEKMLPTAPLTFKELEKLSDPQATLEDIEAIAGRKASPWRARAYERAASLRASTGDFAGANAHLAEIIADDTAPQSLKARAKALQTLYSAKDTQDKEK